ELLYSLIDSILLELNDRFGDENILLLASVSAVHPNNQKFLDIEELKPLASHLTIDINQLDNELNVVKHFIREKRTTMNTIKDLLTELAPVNEAFPATTSLLRGALCLPVSSTTCERSFSRMKLIKAYCRNSTGGERLSDLTVLAVERLSTLIWKKQLICLNAFMYETIRPKIVHTAIKYLIGQELYKDEGIVISNAWIKEYLNERENFIVNDEDKKLNVNENRGEVFDDDDDWNELDDKPISPGAILKYC
ncbi:unnamed protein product, partial [Rotaria socialis]